MDARAAQHGFSSVEAYAEALLVADAIAGPSTDDAQVDATLRTRVDGPFVDMDAADLRQMRGKPTARLGTEPPAAKRGP